MEKSQDSITMTWSKQTDVHAGIPPPFPSLTKPALYLPQASSRQLKTFIARLDFKSDLTYRTFAYCWRYEDPNEPSTRMETSAEAETSWLHVMYLISVMF